MIQEIIGNRYKPCSARKMVELIDQTLGDWTSPLNDRQKEVLIREWQGGMYDNLGAPFRIYLWNKEKPKGNGVLWRLTSPILFVICLIDNILGRPIRWVLTGKWYYEPENWWYNLLSAWYNKACK